VESPGRRHCLCAGRAAAGNVRSISNLEFRISKGSAATERRDYSGPESAMHRKPLTMSADTTRWRGFFDFRVPAEAGER